MDEVRKSTIGCEMPQYAREGEAAFALSGKLAKSFSELALTISLISQRVLFGRCYGLLQADYFDRMPFRSGVYVRPLVTTNKIVSGARRPGDIDLLVIPYEDENIVVSRALAIEIKAVRASFSKQGKSPNEYGLSQAKDLLSLGFPYVGVIHIIISDGSPPSAWQRRSVATILNQEGELSGFSDVSSDWLPATLIDRSFGRITSACDNNHVGLVSAYIEKSELSAPRTGHWIPSGRQAVLNPNTNTEILEGIYRYFRSNSRSFHEIPRYPWRSSTPADIVDHTITIEEASKLKILGCVRKIET